MAPPYAEDFGQILATLAANAPLSQAVKALIHGEPMPGKVTEGGNRLDRFRAVLVELTNGSLDLDAAYRRTEEMLPREESQHAQDNRVFPHDWGERLVRTQLSRCYNQAVMEELLAGDQTTCYVPHSQAEAPSSSCSQRLAGSNHDLRTLYDLLISSYRDAQWSSDVKIPNHPHCTHTVTPSR